MKRTAFYSRFLIVPALCTILLSGCLATKPSQTGDINITATPVIQPSIDVIPEQEEKHIIEGKLLKTIPIESDLEIEVIWEENKDLPDCPYIVFVSPNGKHYDPSIFMEEANGNITGNRLVYYINNAEIGDWFVYCDTNIKIQEINTYLHNDTSFFEASDIEISDITNSTCDVSFIIPCEEEDVEAIEYMISISATRENPGIMLFEGKVAPNTATTQTIEIPEDLPRDKYFLCFKTTYNSQVFDPNPVAEIWSDPFLFGR